MQGLRYHEEWQAEENPSLGHLLKKDLQNRGIVLARGSVDSIYEYGYASNMLSTDTHAKNIKDNDG